MKRIDRSADTVRLMSLRARIFEDIALSISRADDLKTVLGHILAYINEYFQSEAASIILKDELSEKIYFFHARGKRSKRIVSYRLKPGEGICGWVIEHTKPVLTNAPYLDRRFKKEIDREIDFRTRSMICVPLIAGKTVIGAVEILNNNARKRKFVLKDVRVLTAIANQMAMLIHNNLLAEKARERMLELKSLIAVSSAVNSTLDISLLLDKIMELTKKVMRVEGSSLLLVDVNGDLVFRSVTGSRKSRVKEVKIPRGKGIAGWVAEENKPCIVNDVARDKRFYQTADEQTRFKTKQVLAVPLTYGGRVLGVAEAVNRVDGGDFNNGNMKLFTAMAEQCAMAIKNASHFRDLQELFLSSIKALSDAIEMKDPYTRGHSERVTLYSLLIAERMGLAREMRMNLQVAGILHDIGKIGVDEAILKKPDRLTPGEYDIIKKHVMNGVEIMKHIKTHPDILPAIREHHERFDGAGYPDGIAGTKISMLGRIVAVADSYDAMTSDRPYRTRMAVEDAVNEIKRCSGTQFDPAIVDVFSELAMSRELSKLFSQE
ncbi:MAG: HD domain-containing phosphohydrolase [Spirochaetota bacterium]